MQNEGIVLGQRKRIGGEIVQCRISEAERWLHVPALLLLAEDIRNVIGAESSCGVRFSESGGHGFRSVFTNKHE